MKFLNFCTFSVQKFFAPNNAVRGVSATRESNAETQRIKKAAELKMLEMEEKMGHIHSEKTKYLNVSKEFQEKSAKNAENITKSEENIASMRQTGENLKSNLETITADLNTKIQQQNTLTGELQGLTTELQGLVDETIALTKQVRNTTKSVSALKSNYITLRDSKSLRAEAAKAAWQNASAELNKQIGAMKAAAAEMMAKREELLQKKDELSAKQEEVKKAQESKTQTEAEIAENNKNLQKEEKFLETENETKQFNDNMAKLHNTNAEVKGMELTDLQGKITQLGGKVNVHIDAQNNANDAEKNRLEGEALQNAQAQAENNEQAQRNAEQAEQLNRKNQQVAELTSSSLQNSEVRKSIMQTNFTPEQINAYNDAARKSESERTQLEKDYITSVHHKMYTIAENQVKAALQAEQEKNQQQTQGIIENANRLKAEQQNITQQQGVVQGFVNTTKLPPSGEKYPQVPYAINANNRTEANQNFPFPSASKIDNSPKILRPENQKSTSTVSSQTPKGNSENIINPIIVKNSPNPEDEKNNGVNPQVQPENNSNEKPNENSLAQNISATPNNLPQQDAQQKPATPSRMEDVEGIDALLATTYVEGVSDNNTRPVATESKPHTTESAKPAPSSSNNKKPSIGDKINPLSDYHKQRREEKAEQQAEKRKQQENNEKIRQLEKQLQQENKNLSEAHKNLRNTVLDIFAQKEQGSNKYIIKKEFENIFSQEDIDNIVAGNQKSVDKIETVMGTILAEGFYNNLMHANPATITQDYINTMLTIFGYDELFRNLSLEEIRKPENAQQIQEVVKNPGRLYYNYHTQRQKGNRIPIYNTKTVQLIGKDTFLKLINSMDSAIKVEKNTHNIQRDLGQLGKTPENPSGDTQVMPEKEVTQTINKLRETEAKYNKLRVDFGIPVVPIDAYSQGPSSSQNVMRNFIQQELSKMSPKDVSNLFGTQQVSPQLYRVSNGSTVQLASQPIRNAQDALQVLNSGQAIPLRPLTPDVKEVPIVIKKEGYGGSEFVLQYAGKNFDISSNKAIPGYFEMFNEMSVNPLFEKILQGGNETSLKYFEEKFSQQYPTEKIGANKEKFYQFILNEIAKSSGQQQLSSKNLEETKNLLKKMNDPVFYNPIEEKLRNQGLIDEAGRITEISVRTVSGRHKQNNNSENIDRPRNEQL